MRATVLTILFFAQIVVPPISTAGVNKEAKKAFEANNYDQCIQVLTQELRKKPDHQDNIKLMEEAIPLCFEYNKRMAEGAAQRQMWDLAVEHYGVIQRIDKILFTLPPVPKKIKGQKEKQPTTFSITNVSAEYDQAVLKATEMHYAKAEQHEAAKKYKEAAVEYRLTQEYTPSYKEAGARYVAFRDSAMLKIAVMPFEDLSGKNYGALGDMLTSTVISSAMEMNPEFLQFVTRDYLEQILAEQAQSGTIDQASAAQVGKVLGVHAFVFGKVLSISENYQPDTRESGENRETYTTREGKVTRYCRYTVFRRAGTVKISGSFQVVEVATGLVKTSSSLDKTKRDATSWVTYTGDEDAIPRKVQLQNLGERALTTAQDLTTEGIRELGKMLAEQLVETYK